MGIGTYEQYKERLLKMKPNVYLNGKCVDRSNGKEGAERDLADWIKGGTYVMKQCYDVANDPRYEDVCVTTSHIDTPDLPARGRMYAALHGHGRHERPVFRYL